METTNCGAEECEFTFESAINSAKYEADSPKELEPFLQKKWPGVKFNLDTETCSKILHQVLRPEFVKNAFVTGGFFIKFDEDAAFSRMFPEHFKALQSEYGMSIFFDKTISKEFNRNTILNDGMLERFTAKPQKFSFEVHSAQIDGLTVRINLSYMMNGFQFLDNFDYESSKIWFTPKVPDLLYVSKLFLQGQNPSDRLADTEAIRKATGTDLLTSKSRRLLQTFKGLTNNADVDFLNVAENYF